MEHPRLHLLAIGGRVAHCSGNSCIAGLRSEVRRRHRIPHLPFLGELEPDNNDSNPRPVDLCLSVPQDGLPHAISPPPVRWRLNQEVIQWLNDQAGALQLELHHLDCGHLLLQSLQHLIAHTALATIDPLHDADWVPHLLSLQD